MRIYWFSSTVTVSGGASSDSEKTPPCEESEQLIKRQLDPENPVEIGARHRAGDKLILETIIEYEFFPCNENRAYRNAEGTFDFHKNGVGLSKKQLE